MKFKYTILYVEDVSATLAFYEQAFDLKQRFLHEAGDYGELDTGDTVLSFSSLKLMAELGKNPVAANPEKPVFEIALETENVEKYLEQSIAAGAKLVQAVQQQSWGQTIAYVSDPNGFLIEICTPVGGQA